jgi:hypothetical protein
MPVLSIPGLDKLPDFLNTKHLVGLGLYSSINAAHMARVKGINPDYIKFNKRILYRQSDVINFLEKRLRDGSIAAKDKNKDNLNKGV